MKAKSLPNLLIRLSPGLVLILLLLPAAAPAGDSAPVTCQECHKAQRGERYGVLEWVSDEKGLVQVRTPEGVEVYNAGPGTRIRNVKSPDALAGRSGEPVRVRLESPEAPLPQVRELVLKPGIKVPSEARIKGRRLLSLVQKGPRRARYRLIDTRPESVFGAKHIPTAVHLDPKRLVTTLDRERPARDELVILYDQGARWPTAWEATREARRRGFKNVRLYRGGLSDWWLRGKQPVSISNDYLKRLIENDAYPVILDLRPAERLRDGFLPGAVQVDPERIEELRRLFPPDRDATIVLYGEGRITNSLVRTMRRIRSWGYTDIRILEDGFRGWKEAGFPLQTGRPNIMIAWVPPLLEGQVSTVDFMDAADGPLKGDVLLLDVRDEWQTRQGALNNAVCIPLEQLAGRISEIPPSEPVIVFSSDEKLSEVAYHILRKGGRQVSYLPRSVTVDSYGYYTID